MQTTNTLPKEQIIEESVKRETKERVSRVDRELADGFQIVNKHQRTVTIFGSARFGEDNKYYQLARNIGAAISKAGYTVATGGGGGIMEAGNRGAHESGGDSLGFNIKLPHEQILNPYTTESMPFKYFFTRKVIMAYGAEAYVYFPGGFGTMDEFFEVLTLIQTGKMPKAPIILVGSDFWNGLDGFIREYMADMTKAISPGDENLYMITDDVDEVVAAINTHSDSIK